MEIKFETYEDFEKVAKLINASSNSEFKAELYNKTINSIIDNKMGFFTFMGFRDLVKDYVKSIENDNSSDNKQNRKNDDNWE